MSIKKNGDVIRIRQNNDEIIKVIQNGIILFSSAILTKNIVGYTITGDTDIVYGQSYNIVLTPLTGYQTLPWNTKVTMDGVDITSTAYNSSTGAINIANVTGDVSIEAEAVEMSNDYEPVEYITSPYPGNSGSVLNLAYKPNNKTKVVFDVNLKDDTTTNATLLWCANNPNTAPPANRFYAWIKITSTTGALAWGPNRKAASSTLKLKCGSREKFTCDRGVFTLVRTTGATIESDASSDDVWQETTNLRLFGAYAQNMYYGSGTVYGINISEIETIDNVNVETPKKNYVPAKRLSDGVAGLYNLVGQSFVGAPSYILPHVVTTRSYTNCAATRLSDATTGTATQAVIGSTWSIKITPTSGYTFTGGTTPQVEIDGVDVTSTTVTDNGDGTYTVAIANVPDKPISISAAAVEIPYDAEVEYLQGDGSAYIDTGLYGNINLDYEVQAQYTGSATSYNILGDRAAASLRRFTLQINTTGTYFAYVNAGDSNNQINAGSLYRTTSFFTFKKIGLDVYIGNTKIGSFTSQTFTTPRTVLLFAARNNGSLLYPFEGNIKYCKFIINDELVRDFIPVRKDGVGYLYDKVSGQLFGNANSSGAFTYGNDVSAVQSNSLLSGSLVSPSNTPDTPDEPNDLDPIDMEDM